MAESKEEDVRVGVSKFREPQPLGTAAQSHSHKDYKEAPPAPLFKPGELKSWSFYRAGIAEFMATFLFLYITILTVMGVGRAKNKCASVGIQGIAWAFGGMIFAPVYCTAGISVCGAGVVKGYMSGPYQMLKGGANFVNHGYTKGDALGAEIIGTFVLVYTVFSATDAKRNAPFGSPSNRVCGVPGSFGDHSDHGTQASTRLGALEQLSSTTKLTPGMITGSSGWDPSSEQLLQQFTTK
ncbi:hypothetical protein ACS0TY_004252 [Phlomoides rotata]